MCAQVMGALSCRLNASQHILKGVEPRTLGNTLIKYTLIVWLAQ